MNFNYFLHYFPPSSCLPPNEALLTKPRPPHSHVLFVCDPLSFLRVTCPTRTRHRLKPLLSLQGKPKPRGCRVVWIEVKRQRKFHDGTMRASKCVIGLQIDTSECSSQSAMTACGTRRRLYDPKNHTLEFAAPSASLWAPSVPAR